MIATLTQNWWVLALRGLAALLFGISAFVWPGLTLSVLVSLFGVYAVVDGIFAISAGFATRQAQARWWVMVLVGLVGILSGVLTLLWPGMTALLLLYVIAAWSIVTGLLQIVAAIRLRKEIEGEWSLALAGIVAVIFGLLLFSHPGAGALAVTWLIGSYALFFGVMLLVLAFRLRSLRSVVDRQLMGAV